MGKEATRLRWFYSYVSLMNVLKICKEFNRIKPNDLFYFDNS